MASGELVKVTEPYTQHPKVGDRDEKRDDDCSLVSEAQLQVTKLG